MHLTGINLKKVLISKFWYLFGLKLVKYNKDIIKKRIDKKNINQINHFRNDMLYQPWLNRIAVKVDVIL